MRFILVRRPIGNPTQEQLEQNFGQHTEPVALVMLNSTVTEDEMNALGQVVLETIGDKPVNTSEIMQLYNFITGG